MAIDIWSNVSSIHYDANNLLSNRLTSLAPQFVLDRSCEVSTITARSITPMPPAVTTQIPTLRTTTKTTSVTTRHLTATPGKTFIPESYFTSLQMWERLRPLLFVNVGNKLELRSC